MEDYFNKPKIVFNGEGLSCIKVGDLCMNEDQYEQWLHENEMIEDELSIIQGYSK